MGNLSKKDKIILIFLIALGILYIYYAFLLKPILNDNNKKNSEVLQAETKLEEINTADTSNSKYKKQVADFKAKYEQALKALPKNERDPEIAKQLKDLCDKNDIMLSSLNFSKPIEVKNTKSNKKSASSKTPVKIMSVPITMNVSGDYENAVNFLENLEHSDRIAVMDAATFTSNEKTNGNSDDGKVNISLNASYYFILANAGETKIQYDFNKGDYGKQNVFK